MDDDGVFRALADPTRRHLLDALYEHDGRTLSELADGLAMSRQAVTKHLAVLGEAGLVTAVRRGRERHHHLNPAALGDIADRWIRKYHRGRVDALTDLRRALEGPVSETTTAVTHPGATAFVYVSYIRTTPEKLWEALTTPAFVRRYFDGGGPDSDWAEGASVRWSMGGEPAQDWGQHVLESDPPRRLAYTWHNYRPEMQEMFGWSDEKLAQLQQEPISRVAFEIEPVADGAVKLTVTHDGFVPGSEMLAGVSGGWPGILSNLKSLLETGEVVAGR
ncbi:metalloregulator ArsR/SmtB family transcription factor [Actinomycetospora endophytica]|uniref:Metalloregulator ArsR/SmtB family transcription factor n=1 Tax=Actinomycetospora endophytica TaxID=2291215 RepID=A0ABS8P7F8_9PSEU|nr:metalloregulator ArsR/SmtB family transcription factor [Actinomycetospora endophytica]MCD2194191.1 metalloregulator ArsR/SmtB family transcription factor [Actinomycetospora endophytica]